MKVDCFIIHSVCIATTINCIHHERTCAESLVQVDCGGLVVKGSVLAWLLTVLTVVLAAFSLPAGNCQDDS